jgi:serine/threonine protein kinase
VGGIVFYLKRRKASAKDGAEGEDGETSSSRPSAWPKPSPAAVSVWNDPVLLSVQVRLEDIEDLRVLGSGAFGVVYLVRYRGDQLLASKRLRPGVATRELAHKFMDEIKLVSALEHKNVVRFVGAAWSIEADLQALFEFMANGDLRTWLTDASTAQEWTVAKLQLAVDVAEALVYVHSFSPPLVHRDLKSRNVLISNEMEAKLTDFGVSRHQSEHNTMTQGVGTTRWLAPEVIEGRSDYGPAADIFSFGVVLSELDSHKIPYEDVIGANGNALQDVAILQMVATGGLRPTFSRACPPTVLELAQLCMRHDPSERPTAVMAAYTLRKVLAKTVK